MKTYKSTVTIGKHTKSFASDKKSMLTFGRTLSKKFKTHVLIHFEDEMHPVKIKA